MKDETIDLGPEIRVVNWTVTSLIVKKIKWPKSWAELGGPSGLRVEFLGRPKTSLQK